MNLLELSNARRGGGAGRANLVSRGEGRFAIPNLANALLGINYAFGLIPPKTRASTAACRVQLVCGPIFGTAVSMIRLEPLHRPHLQVQAGSCCAEPSRSCRS